MSSVREQILLALHTKLQTLATAQVQVYRNLDKPQKVDGGMIILRDGSSEPADTLLSPLIYIYQHSALVEVLVQNADAAVRDSQLDSLLVSIGTILFADRSLGGVAEWVSAAQSMAIDEYRRLADSQQVDVHNDAMRKGLSESLLIRSLGILAILEWEGVLQAANDDPAPVNEQTVSDLMNIWIIAQEFLKSYVTQFKLLEIEGNALAPAATGTLAEEAPIAASAA